MMRFPGDVWRSILQFTYEIDHRRKMRKVLKCMNEYHAKKRPLFFTYEEDVLYTGMTPCHCKVQIGPCTFFTGRVMMDVHNPCIFALRSLNNYWSLHDVSDRSCCRISLRENNAWVEVHHADNGVQGEIGSLLSIFS